MRKLLLAAIALGGLTALSGASPPAPRRPRPAPAFTPWPVPTPIRDARGLLPQSPPLPSPPLAA